MIESKPDHFLDDLQLNNPCGLSSEGTDFFYPYQCFFIDSFCSCLLFLYLLLLLLLLVYIELDICMHHSMCLSCTQKMTDLD